MDLPERSRTVLIPTFASPPMLPPCLRRRRERPGALRSRSLSGPRRLESHPARRECRFPSSAVTQHTTPRRRYPPPQDRARVPRIFREAECGIALRRRNSPPLSAWSPPTSPVGQDRYREFVCAKQKQLKE